MRIRALVFLLCSIAVLFGCNALKEKNDYCSFVRQKIEYRDSLFINYTVEGWYDSNWHYNNYPQYYSIDRGSIKYFIDACFYSPDKRKLLAWVGARIPNGMSKEIYSKKYHENKLCPLGGENVYEVGGLIGFRNDVSSTWQLYPFDEQVVICADSLSQAENIMCHYYFNEMATDSFYIIPQSGPSKGQISTAIYGYSVLDTNFWTKSHLWQKDTVRSFGLYPFQVQNYAYGINQLCINKNCANPFNPPKIKYPEYIINLFKK